MAWPLSERRSERLGSKDSTDSDATTATCGSGCTCSDTGEQWESQETSDPEHEHCNLMKEVGRERAAQLAGRSGGDDRPQGESQRSRLPSSRRDLGALHTESRAASLEEKTAIIFDWDDTLFPTWYTRAVVEPCSPEVQSSPLPSDSPFYGPLRRHAELVAETLRAARALGRVAILTLARRPWVFDSSARLLPGLDLPALLEELDIPVYYAFEHARGRLGRLAQTEEGAKRMLQDGVDPFAACKHDAMSKCLRELCGRGVRRNVVSIGDSAAERKALRDLLWSRRPGRLPAGALCKTVKFMEESTLQQLGEQLRLVGAWLPSMLAHREDFDLSMDSADEETAWRDGL